MNRQQRVDACRRELANADAAAALLFPSVDMAYLSGFTDEPMERVLFLIVPREGEPIFVAPEMYDEQIRDASWVEDIRTWADGLARETERRVGESVAQPRREQRPHPVVDEQALARQPALRCGSERTPPHSRRCGRPGRSPTRRPRRFGRSDATRSA